MTSYDPSTLNATIGVKGKQYNVNGASSYTGSGAGTDANIGKNDPRFKYFEYLFNPENAGKDNPYANLFDDAPTPTPVPATGANPAPAAAPSLPSSVLAQSNAGLQAATAPSGPAQAAGNITAIAAPMKKKIVGDSSMFPASNPQGVRGSFPSRLY